MRTSGASSPGWFVPTSSAAAWCVRSNFNKVIGTPMSLLKLASLQSVLNRWRSTDASNSFVVVLPFEPPTAIMAGSKSRRYRAASLPSACRVSSTAITAQPSSWLRAFFCSAITAAAPLRAASLK